MDKIARIKSDVQLQSWAKMELVRQDSGLTVFEWCSREQTSKSAYYYRLRKVRGMICELNMSARLDTCDGRIGH